VVELTAAGLASFPFHFTFSFMAVQRAAAAAEMRADKLLADAATAATAAKAEQGRHGHNQNCFAAAEMAGVAASRAREAQALMAEVARQKVLVEKARRRGAKRAVKLEREVAEAELRAAEAENNAAVVEAKAALLEETTSAAAVERQVGNNMLERERRKEMEALAAGRRRAEAEVERLHQELLALTKIGALERQELKTALAEAAAKHEKVAETTAAALESHAASLADERRAMERKLAQARVCYPCYAPPTTAFIMLTLTDLNKLNGQLIIYAIRPTPSWLRRRSVPTRKCPPGERKRITPRFCGEP